MTVVRGDRPVGAVLVGYGYWGARLFRAAERVTALEITGVVDPRCGVGGFAGPPSTPCRRHLTTSLADPAIEAVLIATPAVAHAEVARCALLAGKHVFVEKPFTLTSTDTAELLRLAQAGGRTLTVDHQYWWSAEVAALRRAVDDGAVGSIGAASAARVGDGPVRRDVDALWDLGVHDVSILVALGIVGTDAGQALTVEDCQEVRDGAVAGCVAVTGRTPPGVAVRVHACWMSLARRRELVVSGEVGSLRLAETDREICAWLVRGDRRSLLSRTVKSACGSPVELALREFCTGVRTGPNVRRAIEAANVVAVIEQLTTARPAATTVRSARCWL